MVETPPPQDDNSEDSDVVQQFEAMVNKASERQRGNEPEVYVSYNTDDPEMLERVQQAGEIFSSEEIRNEFLKTQEPNATFKSKVTKVDKWQAEDGSHLIDLSYKTEGIDTPFDIGLQISEDRPWYDEFKDIPDDFEGEIIVETDENGHIASVSLVKDEPSGDVTES